MRQTAHKRSIQRQVQAAIVSDPAAAAKAAGLRYVSDDQPGIRRRRSRKGFTYFGVNGERIRDAEEIRRLNALAIPPAIPALDHGAAHQSEN